MADKYLQLANPFPKQVEFNTTSAGAGDAGKGIALNGSGKVDDTMLPDGVGASTMSVEAGENLTAGDWINLYDDSGLKMRKADATDNSKPADGFVLDAVTSGQNGDFYYAGVNDQNSGLTPGTEYFLHTTAGGESATLPGSTGNIRQSVGKAASATEIIWYRGAIYEV